MTSSEDS